MSDGEEPEQGRIPSLLIMVGKKGDRDKEISDGEKPEQGRIPSLLSRTGRQERNSKKKTLAFKSKGEKSLVACPRLKTKGASSRVANNLVSKEALKFDTRHRRY